MHTNQVSWWFGIPGNFIPQVVPWGTKSSCYVDNEIHWNKVIAKTYDIICCLVGKHTWIFYELILFKDVLLITVNSVTPNEQQLHTHAV